MWPVLNSGINVIQGANYYFIGLKNSFHEMKTISDTVKLAKKHEIRLISYGPRGKSNTIILLKKHDMLIHVKGLIISWFLWVKCVDRTQLASLLSVGQRFIKEMAELNSNVRLRNRSKLWGSWKDFYLWFWCWEPNFLVETIQVFSQLQTHASW